MTVKSRSNARRRFSLRTIVVVVLGVGAVAVACADTRKTLGEECIKDVDCQSGICGSGRCAAAPPILDRDASTPAPDASTDAAEAGDAPVEAAPDAPAETGDGATD